MDRPGDHLRVFLQQLVELIGRDQVAIQQNASELLTVGASEAQGILRNGELLMVKNLQFIEQTNKRIDIDDGLPRPSPAIDAPKHFTFQQVQGTTSIVLHAADGQSFLDSVPSLPGPPVSCPTQSLMANSA